MSSLLAKTDSDVTSLTYSSPNRPVYYVQSPSRDSHDGEKATNSSFQSSPVASPIGSPPHSHSNSSLGPHSRQSSSTRFSASLKLNRKGGRKPWKEFDAIEEEGLLTSDANSHGFPRRCYVPTFLVGFFLLFSLFSLILWGASRSQRPTMTVKSILFDKFVIQAGVDPSGVATDMVSMNSTLKLTFRNIATFFGVHVTFTPLDLSFSQLSVASGTLDKFYESRKSERRVSVTVKGDGVPLYGAILSSLNGAPIEEVPLSLSFMVRSRAYVLGKLVKPEFYKRVKCYMVLDPKKMNLPISLNNNCTYFHS